MLTNCRRVLEKLKIVQARRVFACNSCGLNDALLSQVIQLRDALNAIEWSLQMRHLSSCVLPQLQGAVELTRAISELSARRIGALIAVEREVSLEEYTRSGILLNAELSVPLLLSLFYPGNPLHDGAVIIRGDKILAAACILPLCADREPFRRRGLGTRHRAAVGLSQVSDAVVFALSERTGKISMALGGQLFYNLPLGESDGAAPTVDNEQFGKIALANFDLTPIRHQSARAISPDEHRNRYL